MASGVQILEAYLEFLLRPCQRALVDHWPRPTPAITAPFFTGDDTVFGPSRFARLVPLSSVKAWQEKLGDVLPVWGGSEVRGK